MEIKPIPETSLNIDLERIRSVADSSLEVGNLKYDWVATYSEKELSKACDRCQEFHKDTRATLLIRHSNSNLTLWRGPVGTAREATLAG